jgi:hypothetical protein
MANRRPPHRKGTTGRPYRRLQAWVFATYNHCWICGHQVDKTLPYIDPQTGLVNKLSKSLDHVIPCNIRPDLTLDPANARLAHFTCNSSRGNGTKRSRHATLIASVKW